MSDQGARVKIKSIAHGRSGDKGNTVNIGIIADDEAAYERLDDQLTADRVADHFGKLFQGAVTRYPLPNIQAFNFVCEAALDSGGQASLRYDTQGKTYAASLLEYELPPLDQDEDHG